MRETVRGFLTYTGLTAAGLMAFALVRPDFVFFVPHRYSSAIMAVPSLVFFLVALLFLAGIDIFVISALGHERSSRRRQPRWPSVLGLIAAVLLLVSSVAIAQVVSDDLSANHIFQTCSHISYAGGWLNLRAQYCTQHGYHAGI